MATRLSSRTILAVSSSVVARGVFLTLSSVIKDTMRLYQLNARLELNSATTII